MFLERTSGRGLSRGRSHPNAFGGETPLWPEGFSWPGSTTAATDHVGCLDRQNSPSSSTRGTGRGLAWAEYGPSLALLPG